MKKIAVIGSEGFVGSAFCRMVDGFYDVVRCDLNAPHPLPTKDEANKCDVAIICVPTPMDDWGRCDTSIVEEVIDWIDTPLIVIKSTVVPGTTARLIEETGKPIIFSPEHTSSRKFFLPYEAAGGSDMKVPPMVVAGGDPELCREYFDLLIPILGSEKQYMALSPTEAEITKYMSNLYGGMVVTFANEMYEICNALGADWYKVWGTWGLDPKMSTYYTAVFPEDRGFGGACLPKDISALEKVSIKAGYYPYFVHEILRSNKRFRACKNHKKKEQT